MIRLLNLERFPLVHSVVESGADDRVFDSLMVLGPLVILVIALLGRLAVTTVLAGAYVFSFVVYVLYKAVTA